MKTRFNFFYFRKNMPETKISLLSHFRNLILIVLFRFLISLLFAIIIGFIITPFAVSHYNFFLIFSDFSNHFILFVIQFIIFANFPNWVFPKNFDRLKGNNLILKYNYYLVGIYIIYALCNLLFNFQSLSDYFVDKNRSALAFLNSGYLGFFADLFIQVIWPYLFSVILSFAIWKYFDWKYKKS